jgi:hypothetical protein
VTRLDAPQSPYSRISFLRDVAPLDLATNPAFQLQAGHNAGGELILTYRATRNIEMGYRHLEAGDGVQFILATPEVVRRAVASAKKIGGQITGVIFFRWPQDAESLTMQPQEVLEAAGQTNRRAGQSRIRVVNGSCAAVECMDVYLEGSDPFATRLVRYRINASSELEYFIPERGVPAAMAGPQQIELSLPPYCARGLIYLGRAVSKKHEEFQVEEAR